MHRRLNLALELPSRSLCLSRFVRFVPAMLTYPREERPIVVDDVILPGFNVHGFVSDTTDDELIGLGPGSALHRSLDRRRGIDGIDDALAATFRQILQVFPGRGLDARRDRYFRLGALDPSTINVAATG